MSTALASAREGLFHEASIYASDAELCETALPFLTDGLAAREPTYVILGPHGESLIRRELGEAAGLHYIPAGDAYVNPGMTVKSYRDVLTADVKAGAEQIRFITEVPHPGTGTAWDWWGRYESAANEIFADLPVWAICTYDQRTTPTDVLDEVVRSHPYLARPGGAHATNGEYEPPATFLARRSAAYTDPLESGEPLVELVDPSLSEARRAAVAVAGAQFGSETADNLALAVSEIVTNAKRYGRPPIELRLWVGADRVVATIKDAGDGIHDPTHGLVPVDLDRSGGRGLWIAGQLCDHLSISRSHDGFVIRLVVGTPTITH
jgi:anti-sigma regulatory factor (Ser/Thr protein kinase)